MRRTATIILAVGVATLVALLAAHPAAAHPGFDPPDARTGQRASFVLAVDSHFPGDRVTSVEVFVPPSFRLEAIEPPAGWTRDPDPGTHRFSGELPTGRTVGFRVTGTPTQAGIAAFDLRTASSAGRSMRWTGTCLDRDAPFKAAMLFVDVDLATACEPPARRPVLQQLGIGLIAAAVILGAAYPVVRRARRQQEP